MSDKLTVKLTVKGVELVFEPNEIAYNKFINEISNDNKVAPCTAYLRRVISKDSKEALETILKSPGAGVQLAGKVNEEYAPALEIEVKN